MDGDGDLDDECKYSCWAVCVDDLDTDGYCFDRTVMSGYCSAGICCKSVPIPCGDWDGDFDLDATPEGDLDGDGDVDGDFDGDVDIEVDGDLDGDADLDGDLDGDVDGDGTPDLDGDLDGDIDVDGDGTPDLDGDGDLGDDGECPIDMCWAECVDDLNTDGYCFDRTPLPFWCPVGVCCLSVPVSCPDFEVDGDWDFDGDLTPDLDGDVDGDLDGDLDGDSEGDFDFDGDFTPDLGDGDFDGDVDGDVDGEFDFDGEFTPDLDGDLDVDLDFDGELCPVDMCLSRCVSELVDRDGDGMCWQRISLPFACVVGVCCLEEEVPCREPPPCDTCSEYLFNLSWGSPGSGFGEFSSPRGISVSPAGYVYVADYGNDRVQKFSAGGVYLAEITYPGLTEPSAVAVKADGSYFVVGLIEIGAVAEYGLIEFSSSDVYVRTIVDFMHSLVSPVDVAVGSDFVFVADSGGGRVHVLDSDGVYVRDWSVSVGGDSSTADPGGVAVDSNGLVYVADYGNHTLKVFTGEGSLVSSWGGFGSGDGEFMNPWDVHVDEFDYVYVADYGNNRIQKFASDGSFISSFGVPGSGAGEFNNPSYVFETGFGVAYVADTGNNRLQQWVCNHTLCSIYDAVLDIGNDSIIPWEWSLSGAGSPSVAPGSSLAGPSKSFAPAVVSDSGVHYLAERVWSDPSEVTAKINGVLRGGCLSGACMDCVILGDDCLIPFSFKTRNSSNPGLINAGGDIAVDDINFSFWLVGTVEEVSYASRFRFSEGGNWTIRYETVNTTHYGSFAGNVTYLVPVEADCRDLCFNITYIADHLPGEPPDNPLDAHDAIDDAMYRLLDERLDVSPKDGIIEKMDLNRDGVPDTYFDTANMWFDAKDELGIQTLWGPSAAKLIVWSG